jgi:transposase
VAGEEGKPQGIGRAEPKLTSVRKLLDRAQQRHPGELHVVIEAGGVAWVRLFHAAGAVIHVVDPKQVKRFAQSLCSSGAKSDRRDARTLAELGRSPLHRPEAWVPESSLRLRMTALASEHDQLTQDIVRNEQRLREVLRAWMPLVNDAIKRVDSRWVGRFLRAIPTPRHANATTREEFDGILEGTRCPRAARDALWDALTLTEVPPGLDEAVAATVGGTVRRFLDRIDHLRSTCREVDDELDELTSQHTTRQLFDSVGGIGVQQATALLLHGFEDTPTHRDQAAIQMGACPVFVGSGVRNDRTPKGFVTVRRAAPSRARRAVYLMGRLAIQRLGWAKAMYADARRRGQSAATAFRRIARSLLRILTALLRDNVPYDDAHYVATLKAKGVPWAASL